MSSKVNSFEDKVKLPVTESISRFYQPQRNRKAIRIITVALYVLCVSVAAIMLSLYYIFIYDPTVKPFVPKQTHCDKVVLPEQITIRLMNSSDISTDLYYRNIFPQYQSLKSGAGAESNRESVKDMSVSLPVLIKRIKESLRQQERRGSMSRLRRKHIKGSSTFKNSIEDEVTDDEDDEDDNSSGIGANDEEVRKVNHRVNKILSKRGYDEDDTGTDGSGFYSINDISSANRKFR